jgi:hypothetical protein
MAAVAALQETAGPKWISLAIECRTIRPWYRTPKLGFFEGPVITVFEIIRTANR